MVAEEKRLLKKLERLAAKIVKLLPKDVSVKKSGKTDIFLLKNREMKCLKKRFLPREKGPANVLSFGEPEGWPLAGKEQKKLGEVYLNLDLTDAKMEKLAPLLLHGVLHLLGYDHKKKNDRIEMEKLEKKIISNFQNTNFQ